VAFAEFKVAVLGPDGRPGKATRLRADTDDPARGDVILLAGVWHEVVDIAHVPDESRRPRTVGTVVFCAPLEAPPPWLRALQDEAVRSAGTNGSGPPTAASPGGPPTTTGGGGKLIQLTTLDGRATAGTDPFAAATVRQEAPFSQMHTLARSRSAEDNAPRYVDDKRAFVVDNTAATLRMMAPAATTIEHRPPSPRPTPAVPVPAVDVLSSRGWRRSRGGLSLVLPLVAAALAAAVAASYFLS